jgi:hypothetical protein
MLSAAILLQVGLCSYTPAALGWTTSWRKVIALAVSRLVVPTLALVIMMYSVPMSGLNDPLLANQPNCSTTLESADL